MKQTAPRRKKSIVLRLAIIVFAVYLLVQMGALQKELIDKRTQLNDLKAQHQAIVLQNQELAELLSSGSEQELIERAARDRLGYVFSDEEVFTDISGK